MTRETLRIRIAERADVQTFIALLRNYIAYEKLDPPDEGAYSRLVVDGWGPHPRFRVWLVEDNGRAVAFAVVYEFYSTFRGRKVLHLEDFYVVEDCRHKGVGTLLFHHLKKEAKETGYSQMRWATLSSGSPARPFYEKMGARTVDMQHYCIDF